MQRVLWVQAKGESSDWTRLGLNLLLISEEMTQPRYVARLDWTRLDLSRSGSSSLYPTLAHPGAQSRLNLRTQCTNRNPNHEMHLSDSLRMLKCISAGRARQPQVRVKEMVERDNLVGGADRRRFDRVSDTHPAAGRPCIRTFSSWYRLNM